MRRPTASGSRRFTSLARAVLRLRFAERQIRSHEEVARLLGISAATVKGVEERVLRQLRLTALELPCGPMTHRSDPNAPVAAPGNLRELESILADVAQNDWDEV